MCQRKNTKEIRKYLQQMEITIQHTKTKGMQKKKTVLKGKFISVNAYAVKEKYLTLINKKKRKILY